VAEADVAERIFAAVADDERLLAALPAEARTTILDWLAERASALAADATAPVEELIADMRDVANVLADVAASGDVAELARLSRTQLPTPARQRAIEALRAVPPDPAARAVALLGILQARP
jgi:DNA-binding transcriptional ArsR family regulator